MAVDVLRLVGGLVLLVLLIRVAHILSTTPAGELTQELVYVRMAELRIPGLLLLSTLVLEAVEFVYPFVTRVEVLGIDYVPVFFALFDAIQALLLLVAIVQVFLVVRGYTNRGLEERTMDTLEDLAVLQGRRTIRRRAREPRPDEEPEG